MSMTDREINCDSLIPFSVIFPVNMIMNMNT